MTHDEAVALLGLLDAEAGAVRAVRAAWARKVREVHPDTTPEVVNAADVVPTAALARLMQARDLLLAEIAGHDAACKMCKGSGKVRGRVGAADCPRCSGTGDKVT